MSLGARSGLGLALSTLIVVLVAWGLVACAAQGPTVSPDLVSAGTSSAASMILSSPGRAETRGQPSPRDLSTTASTLASHVSRPPSGTPFDLLIHCGVQYLRYGNTEYKATEPEDPPVRLPSPDGTTAETGYVHGYLQLNGGRTVSFLVADPTVSINGTTIAFEKTSDSPPPCA
jgi:hypothetical protein